MDYSQYIKPELLILIPVLIIIGKIIKDSFVNDKHIPLILGIVSVILSCGYVTFFMGENPPRSFVTGFIQGVLIAGAAVYGNQIFKQYTAKNKNSNDD